MTAPPTAGTVGRTPGRVLVLCLICMTLEGYDIVAYGAALPAILAYDDWGLTIAGAGLIGSLTPVGMLVGASASGVLTDSLGRRRVVLVSVTVFTVAALMSAFAPNALVFGVSRVLVGLGVGAVLPTVSALVYEYSPPGQRNLNTAIVFSGVGIGGGLAAAAAVFVLPSLGFRSEFAIGGLAGIVLLPLVFRYLPESLMFLTSVGRGDEAQRLSRRLGLDPALAHIDHDDRPQPLRGAERLSILLSRQFRLTTILLCLATFSSLLLIFGLSTWLPVLMRAAGYPLGSALSFLAVLSVGTAFGPLAFGKLADNVGSKVAVLVAFSLAIAGIVGLSFPLPTVLLYIAIAIAGAATNGVQVLLNVLIGTRYPTRIRATAIGAALSVGRLGAISGPLLGSILIGAHLQPALNFYAIAATALLGMTCTAAIPPLRRPINGPAAWSNRAAGQH